MRNQQKYNILISAKCLSTLNRNDLNNKLVVSLYDIDTQEKISDGDNEKFEILDYNFTQTTNNKSLNLFILNEIKEIISQIINNNGYDKLLFDVKLFDKAINNDNFIITEYEIGRIDTLAEIYFQIMQKPSKYGDIIELISSYDLQTYK